MEKALAEPGILLVPLQPRIIVESTQLPQPFHRDPADQLLVATARAQQCSIVTENTKFTADPHVLVA